MTGHINTVAIVIFGLFVFSCMGRGDALEESQAQPPQGVTISLDEVYETLPTPNSLTSGQMERVAAFFQDCIGWPEIGNVQIIAAGRKRGCGDLASLELQINGGVQDDTERIFVAPGTGTVWFYSSRGDYNREVREVGVRPHEDTISEDKIWESTARVLSYYNLPLNREEYVLTLGNWKTRERKDNLDGACWMVRKEPLTYRDVPCVGRAIEISGSPLTGCILFVRYKPVVVPKGEPQLRVSQSEAVDRSRVWLSERPYFEDKQAEVSESAVDSLKQVIALPNAAYRRSEKGAIRQLTSEDAYWCWEVPITFVEYGHTFSKNLWVRIDTGEIVGGS